MESSHRKESGWDSQSEHCGEVEERDKDIVITCLYGQVNAQHRRRGTEVMLLPHPSSMLKERGRGCLFVVS